MEIDTTKPNGGRIYDYMLGGNHNFEADRQAADRLLQIFPSVRNGMRMARWFMHEAVERMTHGNYTCYLDLASGLPTEGYVHELVPNAKVMYNDRDPVTVAYAREILGSNPNVRYFHSDISDIDQLLGAADEFFGGERRICVCFIGVSYFLTDEQNERILKRLYEWCAPGTQMAMSWIVGDVKDPRMQETIDMYAKIGSPLTIRTIPDVHRLLGSWQIQDPGLILVTDWLDLETWNEPGQDDNAAFDVLGVILSKP